MKKQTFSPEMKKIIGHRGSDLQIVACAGAGKTEAISRRTAALLAEGVPPEGIIAFTFTERAGAELKERILKRVEELEGRDFLDRLGPMFVGTIHGWCFRLLQERVPRYGNYDVLDEHRHAAFLSREAKGLGLKDLGGKHWGGVKEWMRLVDVIGNELMTRKDIEKSGLLERYDAYVDLLDRFHFLTFSRIISLTVESLEDPAIGPKATSALQHLIVDEYQDINPAQERLIRLLAKPPVELCVVGDDDQAIYQWRGSDVKNILGFAKRRKKVLTVKLLKNRRSRPLIVKTAAAFAESIEDRFPKKMEPARPKAGPMVQLFSAETDEREGEALAETMLRLRKLGWRWQDMAVLLRSVRTAAAPLMKAFAAKGIPASCGGRTGLFSEPFVAALGEVFAHIAGMQWKDGPYEKLREPDVETAAEVLVGRLGSRVTAGEIAGIAEDWKLLYAKSGRDIDLVGDFYRFLRHLEAPERLDPDNPYDSNLLGSIARFSTILADYEHITRRGRYADEEGRRVYKPGRHGGSSYLFGLWNYLVHYAFDAYEDFEGEDAQGADAVQVLTVHQAKGLEWPVVFLPSLTDGRFPSKYAGKEEAWPFPKSVFPDEKRERYAGSDADERRLFYTALTRAREIVYCSCFERKKRSFAPSPYLLELAGKKELSDEESLVLPGAPEEILETENPPAELSFSEAALYEDCGYRYRLAGVYGFEQKLAQELGYGRAVHHVLRRLAETVAERGRFPEEEAVRDLMTEEFYAPFAREASHDQMFRAAERLVRNYLSKDEYREDLERVWAVERPFELHTEEGNLTGRADVILDLEEGRPERLAIVDYKVTKLEEKLGSHDWQLQVYSHAGRREGLDVAASYVHSLTKGTREAVDIGERAVEPAVRRVVEALRGVRNRSFPPKSGKDSCGSCDYALVCRHCHETVGFDN